MEGEIIRTTSCCVNMIIPGRAKQESKDQDIASVKKYYEANTDKLTEKHMCPICNGQYRYKYKTMHLKSVKHLKAIDQLSQD